MLANLLLIKLDATVCRTHFGVRPPMIDSSDVLPLPLGPMSASSSPGRQHPVMLCRICGAIKELRHHLGSVERAVLTTSVYHLCGISTTTYSSRHRS